MHQQTILIVTLAAMAGAGLPFLLAVQATHSQTSALWLTDRVRLRLIWVLTGLGAVAMASTLWVWPHRVSARAPAQTINVTGYQWYWEIDTQVVKAAAPVRFNVHSGDVNHGFGVYDASSRLIFQVQAMPGYVNRVEYTFDTPGTYRILCLEFCGIAHHGMVAEFTVVASNT